MDPMGKESTNLWLYKWDTKRLDCDSSCQVAKRNGLSTVICIAGGGIHLVIITAPGSQYHEDSWISMSIG